MGDANLPTTGENVSVELILNGLPQKIIDAVVSFTERARFQTIETRHIGATGVDIEKIPDGWEGQLEVSRRSGQLDDFVDLYNTARRNRVPVLITITSTKLFNDGTSRTHVYPDCKIDFETSGQRSQNVTTRLAWVCGVDRI